MFIDFARVRALQPNETRVVELVATSQYRSVVKEEGRSNFWSPQLAVMAGRFSLHVVKDSSLASALTANPHTLMGTMGTEVCASVLANVR